MAEAKDFLILVVDDEDDVRDYLIMALEDEGFTVESASDGYEALELVKTVKPDLISLDLVMPKRSGAAFYRDLQKNPEWRKIPVMIVTGHAKDDQGKADLDELTMSGPGIYLEKPVKPGNYVANVRRLIGLPVEDDADNDPAVLRARMMDQMKGADPEALKKALKILGKN
ncbi:MAG TPA: response regulator [Bacteroidetes bacterium]|nr:response regulator MprA [bacterium BMS3Bbin04]HDO65222.1 response regulator [Bacteroidota bacterium]HEX04347.1 response regulator [Bacteroidota bacterium]